MPLPLPLTSPFYFYQLSASSLRWQYDQEPFTSTAHCPKHLSINLLFKMAIAGHIATGHWCHLPFPRSTTLYWLAFLKIARIAGPCHTATATAPATANSTKHPLSCSLTLRWQWWPLPLPLPHHAAHLTCHWEWEWMGRELIVASDFWLDLVLFQPSSWYYTTTVTVRSGVQAILNSSHSSVTNFSSYYFAMVWVLIES